MKQITKPLEDKIIVKRIENPEATANGVILPDIAQENAVMGKVIAVGPGRLTFDGKRIPNECHVGDTVYYLKFEAYKIDVDGEEVTVVREANVLARNCNDDEGKSTDIENQLINLMCKESIGEESIEDPIYPNI
ncbi:MAG: co-chaperone GroES [Melioribacteraceae bacterium]|jgi:chaperonin GroES|nr:co-chaperone GroES [Melioribacteraceae bacterium]